MRVRLVFPVAGLAMLLGACGGSAASTSATASTPVASGGSTAVGSTPLPGGGGGAQSFQAWTDCLTKNGVTVPSLGSFPGGGSLPSGAPPFSIPDGSVPFSAPDGAPGPAGSFPSGGRGGGLGAITSIADDPANSVAVAACALLQPSFGGGAGAGGAVNQQADQAYLTCLTSNGVTVPTSGSTSSSVPAATIDRNDPAFAAANEKCKVLLPQNTASSAQAGATATTSAA